MTLWTKIKHYPRLGLALLAFTAFISLGMPDGLLGVAWPSIRATFGIPLDALGMLIIATTSGYLTSSFLNGPLIARWGVGRVLAVSCALTGAALICYTLVPAWWMMVLLGILAGLGAGAIDAGLNTYVASHFGAGLMQWLHASYGVGVTLGPIIMTVSLTSLNAWQPGYRLVGSSQLLLAACFGLTLAMWNRKSASTGSDEPKRLTDYQTPLSQTLRQPRAWLGMLLFFLYVGAEVSLGAWTYSLLTEARGIAPATAGLWAGSYWATFTIGRVIAGLFARRISIHALVFGGLSGALIGAILLALNLSEAVSLLAVALIGFSIAPIFPALTSGTSRRVGAPHAANAIGVQMAATGLGTAVIPSLMGVLARQISLEVVPLCMIGVFAALLALYLLTVRIGSRE